MKKLQLFTLLILAVSLSNCKKDTVTGPVGAQGATGPSLTGNLKGYISLYDQYGGKILSNQAGDTISIDGTTKKVITDSTGLYTFPGISTGTYTVSVVKPGFGMTKLQNIQFVGGSDTYRDGKIAQPSSSNLITLNDSVGPITGNITVYGTVPADIQARTFVLFVGDNSSVNSSTSNYLIFYTKNINPGVVKVSFVIPKTDLYDAGLATGASAYFAAYGLASTTASTYEDFTNGRTAFTSVSATPHTASVIVP